MSNTTNDDLDKILNKLADGERSWIHDQLDGTSMVEDNLQAVGESVREAKLALTKYITEQEEAKKLERIRQNKSLCGCPMCEHHSLPYELHVESQLDEIKSRENERKANFESQLGDSDGK